MRIPRVLGGGAAALLAGGLALVAGAPGLTGVAAADCVGPTLVATPTAVAPGQRVTVAGTYFGTGCNDTGQPGPVLGRPQDGIELWVRVGDAERQVAVVDAGPNYDFAIEVSVPARLGGGPGEIQARPTDGPWKGVAAVPIQVSGAPLRADDPALLAAPIGPVDRPVEQVGGPDGSDGVPWGWIAVGAVGGAAGVLVVVAITSARRPAPSP